LLIAAVAALVTIVGTTALASGRASNGDQVLRFDVAEDPTRFVFSSEHVHSDGLPAYGNYFVTQGYIYPEGTLVDGEDGVNPDGTPAFPDEVLGEWTCWGVHIGDGAHTTEGPWVVTTQLFSLGAAPGMKTIVTDGYESSEVGVPGRRSITGGTGRYRDASGQQIQTLLGFGSANNILLRVELHVNA
jgi:hypothetical protein